MASEEIRPNLIDLIASYSILTSLSPWLSTLDLHNLSLTSRSAYAYIHFPKIFSYLTRQSLCDGHGLLTRQAYAGPYCSPSKLPGSKLPGALTYSPHLQGDEEIEVHLYNVKYKRWICVKCKDKEEEEAWEYFDERTTMEWEWMQDGVDYGDDSEPSKTLTDHAFTRAYWCKCGKAVSHEAIFRCIWCKRRHLHEDEWEQERYDVESQHPFFDDNPNYPIWKR
ncbi:hypothetical protein LB507_010309 [Fusarium sp. FIESC RH6]|nr:hypothetical protein LB507_010309 [Fusarium sp. FIESC RH6]